MQKAHFLPRSSWLHTIQIHTELDCSYPHYWSYRHFWEEKPISYVYVMFSNLVMEGRAFVSNLSSQHSLLPADGRMLLPTTIFQVFSQTQNHNKHLWKKAKYRQFGMFSPPTKLYLTVSICTATYIRLFCFCGSDKELKLPVWLFLGAKICPQFPDQ